MNYYSQEQVASFINQNFAYLEIKEEDHVLTITLNRANKKNALHPQMVNEIAYAMNYAHLDKNIWVVVIQANGNIFCSGADLKAMAGFIEENDSTIPPPKGEILLGELFNKIYKPTITKVTGDVYAGGFFFLAGSNIVVAQEGVIFGLPEVKRGLYPFQVMSALLKVMPARKVVDWCIRGYKLPVEDAQKFGLVTEVVSEENINARVSLIINEIKENSPTAIKLGLEAYDQIRPTANEHKYLLDMLMKTIATKDGQEGLLAFREKRKPNWLGE